MAANFLSRNATLKAEDCLLLEASEKKLAELTNYLGSCLLDDSVNASFSLDMSDKQMIAGHFATISKQVAQNIGIYSLMYPRDT